VIGNGHAGFGRAASEKDPQGHLAGVVPRHAAIPARSRRNGHENGFAKRCAHGERATALRRPPTTGPAPTHAGAAAKRSNDYRPENGPRRPPSRICTEPGRRPAPTPSAAPERLGANAVDIRTPRLSLAICERGADGRRKRYGHPPGPAVTPAYAPVTAPPRRGTVGCACRPPRIGPPASTSATPATSAKHARALVPPDAHGRRHCDARVWR